MIDAMTPGGADKNKPKKIIIKKTKSRRINELEMYPEQVIETADGDETEKDELSMAMEELNTISKPVITSGNTGPQHMLSDILCYTVIDATVRDIADVVGLQHSVMGDEAFESIVKAVDILAMDRRLYAEMGKLVMACPKAPHHFTDEDELLYIGHKDDEDERIHLTAYVVSQHVKDPSAHRMPFTLHGPNPLLAFHVQRDKQKSGVWICSLNSGEVPLWGRLNTPLTKFKVNIT